MDRLRNLPVDQRSAVLVTLWADLLLDRETLLAGKAILAGATPSDIELLVRRQGQASVEHLLVLIETYAEAHAWNERGTPAFAKHGAAGPDVALASSAAFAIAELKISVPDAAIARLQECLRCRLGADERMNGPVPTLAENIARTMHALWPKRFPATVMNAATNRLENPDPFLR